MRRPSPVNNKRRRATHQWILFTTESFDVTPKTTEQNLIARTGKSEAEVTSNKRLRSRYCTVEENYSRTHIARPLCASRASCFRPSTNFVFYVFLALVFCIVLEEINGIQSKSRPAGLKVRVFVPWALAIILPHRIIWSWCTGRWCVGCYIWYSEEGTGQGRSPLRLYLAVPNVTAHPSTAVYQSLVWLYNGR